jgi:transcriptional regulator with PAS, ATPase and Fis domain
VDQLVLVGDFYGKRISFPIPKDTHQIFGGSLPGNTIYLPYKGVSRRHFSLAFADSGWIIRDEGSTNGIRINGKRLKESPIQVGDTIEAGSVKLQVESQTEVDSLRFGTATLPPQERGTDPMNVVPIAEKQQVFYFPDLVFPKNLILGNSPKMFEVYKSIHAVAESDMNILLVGETGAGKEMIAETLHLSSKRSKHPFIAVNCGAIPADLAEAELFGIGPKVATDVSERKGKIAAAHNGTLFLDEISSFPMTLQAKILRAIEERLVYPVGEHVPQKVNFRLVAATNEDPQSLIAAGRLRSDLYHRFSAVEIHIPPLRERKEDLDILILGLLRQISKKENKRITAISKTLLGLLRNYSYPGNVRELYNILVSIVAVASPGQVLDVHLAPAKLIRSRTEQIFQEVVDSQIGKETLPIHKTLDEVARKLVLHALDLKDGNLTHTAKYLDISVFGLRKMMKRLGIERPERNKK